MVDEADPTAELTPYNIVMQQARDINNSPAFPPMHDPNASVTNNMLRGLLTGLSALAPGSRFPHVRARNLQHGPSDPIPTVGGGSPNAPFGSSDIANYNLGMRRPGHEVNIPGMMVADNANNPAVSGPRVPQAIIDRMQDRYNSGRFSEIPGGREHPNPQANTIVNWLADSNVPITSIENRGGTHYITARDSSGQPVWVRIPSDNHAGRPINNREVGSRFDMGTETFPGRINPIDPRTTHNSSGQPYSNTDTLIQALQARLSASPSGQWLTPPDVAPIFRQPIEPTPPRPNTQPDRNQLKLDLNLPPITDKGGPGSGGSRYRRLPPPRTEVAGTVYNGPPLENIIVDSRAQSAANVNRISRLLESNPSGLSNHIQGLINSGHSNFEIAQRIKAMTGQTVSPGQVLSYRRNVLGQR